MSSEETDTSDSEEEEVVEPEKEMEEEEQQKKTENEERLVECSSEKDLEQVSDDEEAGRSSPETGDDSSRNWAADGLLEMHGADITKEDSASSVTLQREDSHTISEYKSEDEYQFEPDNDSGSDSATEEPNNDSADEFLSASSGDEELFALHRQSQAMKETHQTESVLVQELMRVPPGEESRVTRQVTQKQPATDLPHHQFQDTEDTLEQVINLPEQTQAVQNVSQSKTLSVQGEMQSSAWVEEASPSAQLPGLSPAAGITTPSITIQGEMQSSVPVEETTPSRKLSGPSPAASIMTPSSTVQGKLVISTA